MLLSILAGISILLFTLLLIELAGAGRSIPKLGQLSSERSSWPSVSIVIAALNEEATIAEALDSVLALDYPDLEVVFVDDRSSDATGSIVAARATKDRRLRLVTVRELPEGWLGKNHALHVGAGQARGEMLLFTDADIVFEPTALRRAVGYMEDTKIDHLTAGAEVRSRSVPLGMFIAAFGFFFVLYARPWRARNPRSRAHVGIGAFNLVRSSVYRRMGGHEPIAMRTDDDMMLGKLVKKSGAIQDFVSAIGMIRVEWYPSVREAIRGLEKNAFTGCNYSMTLVVMGTLTLLALYVWPFVALFVTDGWLRAANGLIVAVILSIIAILSHATGSRWWYAFGFPFATLLFIYVLWRSAILALANGGIDWRGTHYPLAALRANKV